MENEKATCETRGRKERGVVVSTPYGGVTRVRFGGSIPRVGKSRLRERGAPLSYVGDRLAGDPPLVKMTARPALQTPHPANEHAASMSGKSESMSARKRFIHLGACQIPTSVQAPTLRSIKETRHSCTFGQGVHYQGFPQANPSPKKFRKTLKKFLIWSAESATVRPCTGRSSAW